MARGGQDWQTTCTAAPTEIGKGRSQAALVLALAAGQVIEVRAWIGSARQPASVFDYQWGMPDGRAAPRLCRRNTMLAEVRGRPSDPMIYQVQETGPHVFYVPLATADSERVIINLRRVTAEEHEVALAELAAQEEDRRRVARAADERRRSVARAEAEAEAALQVREEQMRKCACLGTGYELEGMREVNRGFLKPSGGVLVVRGRWAWLGFQNGRDVHRFHPSPCPECGGANRVRKPPAWEPQAR